MSWPIMNCLKLYFFEFIFYQNWSFIFFSNTWNLYHAWWKNSDVSLFVFIIHFRLCLLIHQKIELLHKLLVVDFSLPQNILKATDFPKIYDDNELFLWHGWPTKCIKCLISSWDHCQRSSPSRISNMLQTGFEPGQNLNLHFVEWSCAIVITTTPRQYNLFSCCNLFP